MKNKVLLTSAILVGITTLVGVLGALLASDPNTIARFTSAGGILALGSIGLFMVGLAVPKEQSNNVEQISNRKAN